MSLVLGWLLLLSVHCFSWWSGCCCSRFRACGLCVAALGLRVRGPALGVAALGLHAAALGLRALVRGPGVAAVGLRVLGLGLAVAALGLRACVGGLGVVALGPRACGLGVAALGLRFRGAGLGVAALGWPALGPRTGYGFGTRETTRGHQGETISVLRILGQNAGLRLSVAICASRHLFVRVLLYRPSSLLDFRLPVAK